MPKHIKISISIIVLTLIVACGILYTAKLRAEKTQKLQTTTAVRDFPKIVRLGNAAVSVVRRTTDKEREQGLSGTKELAQGHGMLFIFPFPDLYPFWMKDMHYPIDIIWFDADQKVAYIKEHATLESYPELFTPDTPSLYVLEVPDGFIKQYKIQKGDTAIFE